jgi:hypothetical protein
VRLQIVSHDGRSSGLPSTNHVEVVGKHPNGNLQAIGVGRTVHSTHSITKKGHLTGRSNETSKPFQNGLPRGFFGQSWRNRCEQFGRGPRWEYETQIGCCSRALDDPICWEMLNSALTVGVHPAILLRNRAITCASPSCLAATRLISRCGPW